LSQYPFAQAPDLKIFSTERVKYHIDIKLQVKLRNIHLEIPLQF